MIKAVIFDVDGVLLDSADAIYAFFTDLFISFGYADAIPPREEFAKNFHMPMKDQIRLYVGATSPTGAEKVWEGVTGGEVRGVDYSLTKAPEHSVRVVGELAAEYPLGIVTNKMKANMWKGDHMAALQPHFKIALGYDDVQNPKPHPEPLLLAAKNLGVAPEECVFIGDMESDFTAGKAAGMKVIMFGKNKIPGADGYVDTFAELPDVIRKL